MNNVKLRAAAELIQEKRYREARALLKTIRGDARVYEWLARLDDIAPEKPYQETYDALRHMHLQAYKAMFFISIPLCVIFGADVLINQIKASLLSSFMIIPSALMFLMSGLVLFSNAIRKFVLK